MTKTGASTHSLTGNVYLNLYFIASLSDKTLKKNHIITNFLANLLKCKKGIVETGFAYHVCYI